MSSISHECFISDSRLILTTFWPSRISIQHFIVDPTLFNFSNFFVDKVKLVNQETRSLCFQPILHEFLSIFQDQNVFPSPLTTHSCFFQFLRSLTDLGSALATYGGLLYFGKSTFLSSMSCLHATQFSYEGCNIYVHYYSPLFNGRIHTNIHLFIHVIQSLFSLYFSCVCL